MVKERYGSIGPEGAEFRMGQWVRGIQVVHKGCSCVQVGGDAGRLIDFGGGCILGAGEEGKDEEEEKTTGSFHCRKQAVCGKGRVELLSSLGG